MKTNAFAATTLGAAMLALASPAFAQTFQIGDHVMIASSGRSGVVLNVGGQLADGGTMISVHFDNWPGVPATTGVQYDTKVSGVTVTSHATGPAPKAAPAPTPPPGPANTSAGLAGQCQAAIRANYPATGADQTITVNFQSFQMGGQHNYEAIYANDLPGSHGHVVQSAPIRAKFSVLVHYADPLADDSLRTYDHQYECYVPAKGGAGRRIVEETHEYSTTSQYIHKK